VGEMARALDPRKNLNRSRGGNVGATPRHHQQPERPAGSGGWTAVAHDAGKAIIKKATSSFLLQKCARLPARAGDTSAGGRA
jgi:hypothetical protein